MSRHSSFIQGTAALLLLSLPTAAGCQREASSAPSQTQSVVAVADVDGDGRRDALLKDKSCGSQGCGYELRLASGRSFRVGTLSKGCGFLSSYTHGYLDLDCIELYDVETAGQHRVRVVNGYRFNGTAYASPLDHVSNTVLPPTPAPCARVVTLAATEVLLLPARGVRVSVKRPSPPGGAAEGAPGTPVVATVPANESLGALQSAPHAESGTWLLVRVNDHQTGWVEERAVRCVSGDAF